MTAAILWVAFCLKVLALCVAAAIVWCCLVFVAIYARGRTKDWWRHRREEKRIVRRLQQRNREYAKVAKYFIDWVEVLPHTDVRKDYWHVEVKSGR